MRARCNWPTSKVRAELVGRPFYDTFLGEAPAPDADLPVERAMREGVTVRGVLPAPARGMALRVSAAPHVNGGAIVMLEEERAAPHVLDRNARVLEAASDAVLTLDQAGLVTFANPAAHAMFGRTDLDGGYLRDLLLADELPALERALQQTLAGSSPRAELRIGSEPLRMVEAASLRCPWRVGSRASSSGCVTSPKRVRAPRRWPGRKHATPSSWRPRRMPSLRSTTEGTSLH
ncbi:MAG: PAS domain-containing protein [Gemmatimonadaceae bacterium]